MNGLKRSLPYLWIFLFIPASSLLAGILAAIMRLSNPISGSHGFWDVLLGYAPFWPGTYGVRHIPSLVLGLAVLLLLTVSRRTRKPVVSLLQIRIILLVLLCLITIVAKTFSVVTRMDDSAKAFIPLFLYADLDLFFTFLLTFLPSFRRPGARPEQP